MRVRNLLLIPAVAGIALATWTVTSRGDQPGDGAVSTISIVATDHSFEAPERMPAGVVTIQLQNNGQEPHHAQLVRFRDGKTVEDMMASIQAGRMPEFAVWEGGPSVIAPGGQASVTLNLRPGTYFWLCFVESMEDHAPHLAKGMIRQVVVEGPSGGELPRADNALTLSDYDFQLGRPLRSGPQTIRVRNQAAQPHEVMFFRLLPGKSMQDFQAWAEGGMMGEPPAMPVGGMQALSNGRSANLDIVLERGTYILLCVVPDHKDMKPHAAHGMIREVTVE